MLSIGHESLDFLVPNRSLTLNCLHIYFEISVFQMDPKFATEELKLLCLNIATFFREEILLWDEHNQYLFRTARTWIAAQVHVLFLFTKNCVTDE